MGESGSADGAADWRLAQEDDPMWGRLVTCGRLAIGLTHGTGISGGGIGAMGATGCGGRSGLGDARSSMIRAPPWWRAKLIWMPAPASAAECFLSCSERTRGFGPRGKSAARAGMVAAGGDADADEGAAVGGGDGDGRFENAVVVGEAGGSAEWFGWVFHVRFE
jgi:hypothetical protein